MSDLIFGLTWDAIQAAQQGGKLARNRINTDRTGDYGADPMGDGTFRMVPSGRIVSFEERNAILSANA